MKAQLKNLDAFQIAGFILSLVVSIALLVAQQDTITSITLGLVLATLTQLFDMQKRHSDSEERILQANALSQTLYRDEFLLTQVQKIVDSYQAANKGEIQRNSFAKFFADKARTAIIECAKTLAELSKGHVTITRLEQTVILEELLQMAHEKARAVSHISYEWWWRSPIGESYLRENEKAIRKGITITRIFIVPRAKIDELKNLIYEHHQAGVDVWIAIQEEQSPELLGVYLIVDESIVSKTQLGFDGQFRGAYITVEPYEIESAIRDFNWLLRGSRRAEEVYHFKST